ncbi:MAG: response regulator [Elusimicrobiota bacterium]
MNSANIKRGLGTTELARLCDVTPPTVGRWIKEGKLPSFTTAGGHRRVWAEDVVAFLREHNIPAPPELRASARWTVLIVDDEQPTRKLIARVVGKVAPEAEIHEAADGFEAGHKITELVPDLVVLDIRLPGVDGMRICRSIRNTRRFRRVRVLAVSGYAVEETRKECLEAGADDFVGKPFDIAEMERSLYRLAPTAVREGKK